MKWALAVIALTACEASRGTLELELTTAPGSSLLAAIDRVRLTLTNPSVTFDANRTADGLDLAFEIEAITSNGVVLIEGFDVNGTTIAVGQSPPFALAGGDAKVVIYVAPPYSILQAPVDLLPARSQIGGAAMQIGAVLAGGFDAAGLPSASMQLYNIYNHSFGNEVVMPIHRGAPTLATSGANVYVLGGIDEVGAETSTLYRFQSNVAPDGLFVDLGSTPGLESSGQRAVTIGPDTIFVTGGPPVLLRTAPTTTVAALELNVVTAATAALTSDNAPIAAFLQDGIYTVGTFDVDGTVSYVDLPSPGGFARIVAGNEPGTVIVVGGWTRHVYFFELSSGAVTVHTETLSVTRHSPTVAATARHILVANGFDENGTLIETADILDKNTLELIVTVPLHPRANAIALAMPNDQILIAGGDYLGNPPDGLVELFTPPVPTDLAPP